MKEPLRLNSTEFQRLVKSRPDLTTMIKGKLALGCRVWPGCENADSRPDNAAGYAVRFGLRGVVRLNLI
jgi:hypothetical protein